MGRRIGKNRQYMHQLFTGKTKLSGEIASKLSDEFGINVSYLFTGRGDPWSTITRAGEPGEIDSTTTDEQILRELENRLGRTAKTVRPEVSPLIIAERPDAIENIEGQDVYRAIPYLADPAGAGTGRVMEEQIEGYVVVHERVAPHPQNLVAVRVAGDSMTPTLPDGSIVAIDTTKRNPTTLHSKVICVRTDEEVVIKRLHYDGKHIILTSDNRQRTEHPDIIVDMADAENLVIGQVVWAWVNLE